jgi:hypothetical protein
MKGACTQMWSRALARLQFVQVMISRKTNGMCKGMSVQMTEMMMILQTMTKHTHQPCVSSGSLLLQLHDIVHECSFEWQACRCRDILLAAPAQQNKDYL